MDEHTMEMVIDGPPHPDLFGGQTPTKLVVRAFRVTGTVTARVAIRVREDVLAVNADEAAEVALGRVLEEIGGEAVDDSLSVTALREDEVRGWMRAEFVRRHGLARRAQDEEGSGC